MLESRWQKLIKLILLNRLKVILERKTNRNHSSLYDDSLHPSYGIDLGDLHKQEFHFTQLLFHKLFGGVYEGWWIELTPEGTCEEREQHLDEHHVKQHEEFLSPISLGADVTVAYGCERGYDEVQGSNVLGSEIILFQIIRNPGIWWIIVFHSSYIKPTASQEVEDKVVDYDESYDTNDFAGYDFMLVVWSKGIY